MAHVVYFLDPKLALAELHRDPIDGEPGEYFEQSVHVVFMTVPHYRHVITVLHRIYPQQSPECVSQRPAVRCCRIFEPEWHHRPPQQSSLPSDEGCLVLVIWVHAHAPERACTVYH